ncbi:hypothetical protein A3F07_04550 [candidate division WWE3 bacterium RIFCSPHIGHO2_12_FULL_38_15]|uniref:Uncharacterized protein n=1 Tax=candidate division WWE3 bacterium RIFCSPHIGHO2_02_FULL_38_14 TaxID=1802620 RepID=A0A1F4VBP1_UNCKA|nr:MAG: hypothetical protein A2793_03970 [candidate division WWE3 bacterium RIFCSPHIGHO2_01_FULL_38_45]OGC49017.1 MAG: hypothetical protein A3F07_04550 [candidate division WWE3 bacterium RIFCSPHIGHO2_12_FULL_38_15]OGC54628.1 MAG: hypothetical protein A3B64_03165 [candidate division WWE3 bacterium RIFCSPLOWO2_01_FULL_37_24]OGC54662.1 MAG: hypothetical protein A3D91_03560 [candidate division WWE3 bacterium RIFCSPHIGHO2_02_FULL_38_14]HLB51370.1 hypothetical protein [Patescibacteria group bacterium
MLELRHFRFLNPEWFRKPQSKLEATLRIPLVTKEIGILALTRVFPLIAIFSLTIRFLITFPIIPIVLGVFLYILFELWVLERWYKNNLLPYHIKNIDFVNKMEIPVDSNALIGNIEKSIRMSAYGIVRIGYVGLASWGWEMLFKFIYPLIARDKEYIYSDLLIGMPNKVLEFNQTLWEVANETDNSKKVMMYQSFLDKFGSVVDDMDLSFRTFREKPNAIKILLDLNKDTIEPDIDHQKTLNRYQSTLNSVKLIIPFPFFINLVNKVRANVVLREDRRFYEFVMDYKIRVMILELGKRKNIAESELFNKSWEELKK